MNRSAKFLLLIPLLAAACSSVQPITPSTTPTSADEPESQPLLLPTQQERSAYILNYGRDGLTLYDLESARQTNPHLPPLWDPLEDLQEITSAGLVAVRSAPDPESANDLQLLIVRLPEGEILRRIPLFSEELSAWMQQHDETPWEGFDPSELREAVTFQGFRPRWSPDGTRVAFTAAREGTFSNVYLYDLESDQVRRLTNERDHAVLLGWSPDGAWLLYATAFGFDPGYQEYFPLYVKAVSPQAGEVKALYEPIHGNELGLLGWQSMTAALLWEYDSYYHDYVLIRIDLAEAQATELFSAYLHDFDLDPESGTLAVLNYVEDRGLTLAIARPGAEPNALEPEGSDNPWYSVRWYSELGLFMAASNAGVFAFTVAGEFMDAYESEYCLPVASPDARWLAFGPCGRGPSHRPGLRIYDSSGTLRYRYEESDPEQMVWAPDGAALYYTATHMGLTGLVRLEVPRGPKLFVGWDVQSNIALLAPEPQARAWAERMPAEAPTPVAAAPPTPGPTPSRALDPSGPWLVGQSEEGIVALNADGSGRSLIFPELRHQPSEWWQDEWLDFEVAGSGWIAVRLSDADGIPQLLVGQLPEPTIRRQLPIMSAQLIGGMLELDSSGNPAATTKDVYLAMDGGGWFDQLAWSPDGRKLAYVAAVDGPSADLYLYDSQTDEVLRLTDGPNQPILLGWSPDGRWVLHYEISDIFLGHGIFYDSHGLWAAAADGSGAKLVPDAVEPRNVLGWVSATRFLSVRYDQGMYLPYELGTVDLDSGPARPICAGDLGAYAVAPEAGATAFVVDVYSRDSKLEAGLYTADVADSNPQPVTAPMPENAEPGALPASDIRWSPELDAFLVNGASDQIYAMSTEGELRRTFQGECSIPLVSPDGEWLAFETCGPVPGIRMVHLERGETWEFASYSLRELFWHPDSSGIYFFEGVDPSSLMFLPVEGGTPKLVHPDPGMDWSFSIIEVEK